MRAVEDERCVRGRARARRRARSSERAPSRRSGPLQLPGLADVDEDRRVARREQLVGPRGVDLEDKLAVTGHAPRIIVARMSPRTRIFVIAGAAAALAAGATVALAVITAGDKGGSERRRRRCGRAAARPRPRRARRSRGAGAPAGRAALLAKAARRGRPDLRRATTRRRREIGAAFSAWPDYEPGDARAPGPGAPA